AAGICNTGGNAGGLLAPILTPYLGEHFGWPYALAVAGLACLLGAILWWWIDPAERVNDPRSSPVPPKSGSLPTNDPDSRRRVGDVGQFGAKPVFAFLQVDGQGHHPQAGW